jgi:protein TonB
MAGVRKLHEGVALPRSADARGDAGPADLSSADLSNVVPFARLRATRQVPEVILSSEATRPATGVPYDRVRLAAFVALSLMVHAGLLLALSREPAPLASIGEQVISLEIVVGASAPAGVAQTPGEQAVQAAAAPEPQQPKTPQEPEKATEQPQPVQSAPAENAPEQTAKPETPVEPEAATETPKAQQPKPTKDRATRQAKASAPSTAANNVGVGRSDADSNYAGLVSAHLRRYQQYPADARSRGEQGTATVSFSLDGGGRVTSARLVRGSGVASIDAEVQAMVRRASPFPAPPSGRGVSFTVPVRFQLH